MKIEHVPNIPALRRDWLVARIVGTLGVLLIAAVAVLSAVALVGPQQQQRPAVPSRPAVATTRQPTLSPAQIAQARRAEGIALCDAALAAVQKTGLVPGFAVRTSDDTAPAPQGRYTCTAKTDVSAYAITFDLACPKLAETCILPYEISQDGTSIYRRK
jgi:hypothetical protein